MSASLQICIADDHPIVISGVRALLAQVPEEMHIGCEAVDGEMLLQILEKHSTCNILLLDFCMSHPGRPGRDGLPLIQALRRRHPQLKIIVLTMIQNPALLRTILDQGVCGIVSKASSMTEVLQAIRTANLGRLYISHSLRAELDLQAPVKSRALLSPHELEVVRLFVRGMSVTEISEKLSRSVKTISRQKSDAMRKLGTSNPSQLYAYARDCGLDS